MSGLSGIYVFWGVVAIQAIGLISAWVARMSSGSRGQVSFQRIFTVCLVLVGATAIVTPSVGSGCWMVSSATLAVMVLAATYDFRTSDRAVSSL